MLGPTLWEMIFLTLARLNAYSVRACVCAFSIWESNLRQAFNSFMPSHHHLQTSASVVYLFKHPTRQEANIVQKLIIEPDRPRGISKFIELSSQLAICGGESEVEIIRKGEQLFIKLSWVHKSIDRSLYNPFNGGTATHRCGREAKGRHVYKRASE